VQIEEQIEKLKNNLLSFAITLILVGFTEIFPIISLILTVSFILRQRSTKVNSIGEKGQDLLEDSNDNDSDVEDNRRESVVIKIKSIRSLIINEFIDKDDLNSEYSYKMKDKKAGREIFWTYHFFEYIDDLIDNSTKLETTQDKESDEIQDATDNFEALTKARKMQRTSTRKKKDIINNLDEFEKNRCDEAFSSIHSHAKPK